MSDHDWITVLARGNLALSLPVLKFVQAGSPRFHGSGRLVWNQKSGVKIHAVTDGAEELRESFGRAGTAPGKLIPRETYISAAGQTQDGWDVSTTAVPLRGYTVSFESPHVLWEMTSRGLTMSRSLPARAKRDRRIIRALLEPPPKHWPRMTTTEVQNEFFGGRSFQADWLQATTRLGTLLARQHSETAFEARLLLDSDTAPEDPFEIMHAVAQAFSFVLGRRIWIHGLEDVTADGQRRELYPYRTPTENSLRPPLGDSSANLANIETLLGKAVDFFLTAQGREVAEYLELCWDTTDNDFTTSITVVAISVESLLRVASESLSIDDPGYTSADRQALLSWVANQTAHLTKRFLARVGGFIKGLGHRRPIDVLWSWQREGLLGISPEDIDAWEKSRHSAAHGALAGARSGREELQQRFDRFPRVQNLMNRIVLHLIGYRGFYVDYSQAGWPEVEFSPPKSHPGTEETTTADSS